MRRVGGWAGRRTGVLLAICTAACGPATPRAASTPDAWTTDAVRALTGGGCASAITLRDTSFAFFPGVHFHRGYCTGEHGDPITGTVAIDGDGLVYLLGSESALRFLLIRHPITPIDSGTVLAYSLVALELTGHSSAHSRPLSRPEDASPALRRALESIRGRTSMVIPMGSPRTTEWKVFMGRTEPAYQGRREFFTEVWIDRDGRATVMEDTLLTPLPVH